MLVWIRLCWSLGRFRIMLRRHVYGGELSCGSLLVGRRLLLFSI